MYIYIICDEVEVGRFELIHVPKQFFHSPQEALDNVKEYDIIIRMTLGVEGYDVLSWYNKNGRNEYV